MWSRSVSACCDANFTTPRSRDCWKRSAEWAIACATPDEVTTEQHPRASDDVVRRAGGRDFSVSGAVLYISLAGTLNLSGPLGLLSMHAETSSAQVSQDDSLRAAVGHLLGGSVVVVPFILVLAVAG